MPAMVTVKYSPTKMIVNGKTIFTLLQVLDLILLK